jgi:hypothetical protein
MITWHCFELYLFEERLIADRKIYPIGLLPIADQLKILSKTLKISVQATFSIFTDVVLTIFDLHL